MVLPRSLGFLGIVKFGKLKWFFIKKELWVKWLTVHEIFILSICNVLVLINASLTAAFHIFFIKLL